MERSLFEITNSYRLRLQYIHRGVSYGVSKLTNDRTPVLTGRLKASWTGSVGMPDGSNRGGSIVSVTNTLTVKDTYFYSNGRTYARRIEYTGYSAKAPDGMMRISMAEAPRIAQELIRKAQRL